MGTRFELVLVGDDDAHLRGAAEEALATVPALSDQLNAFYPSSTISSINANAAARPIALDRELFDLLDLCREGWLASEGAFDITVGPLMEAWGFRKARLDASMPHALVPLFHPTSEVQAAQTCVGMDKVELDRGRGTIRFAVPGMRLDLGGVAKGW